MDKRVTSDDPEWAQAVYDAMLEELENASLGEKSRVKRLVSWREGNVALVIYERNDLPGIYGRRFDTKEGAAGALPRDPQQAGWENGAFLIEEPPRKRAPKDYVDAERIFWIGEVCTDQDLPTTVPEAQKRAEKMRPRESIEKRRG